MGERIFVWVTAATTLVTTAVSVLVIVDPAIALPEGSMVTPAVESCALRSLLARCSTPALGVRSLPSR